MPTTLIQLEDGILVEVDAADGEFHKISGGDARKVEGSLDQLKPLLIKSCQPILSAWSELNKKMIIEGAEIELGINFEAEGNVYLAKAKAGSNLSIKLILKPIKKRNTKAKYSK